VPSQGWTCTRPSRNRRSGRRWHARP
jgi:hypothetical protein